LIVCFQESKVDKITAGTNIKIHVTDVSHLKKGYISCMLAAKKMLHWKKDKEINDYGQSRAPDEIYTPV
jgi:hypothetical protein